MTRISKLRVYEGVKQSLKGKGKQKTIKVKPGRKTGYNQRG